MISGKDKGHTGVLSRDMTQEKGGGGSNPFQEGWKEFLVLVLHNFIYDPNRVSWIDSQSLEC